MRILDSNNTFSSETFSDLSHDAQCPHKICSGSGIESKLPHAFIKRMRTDFETTAEYERFIACYSDAPIRAMRINTLKISKERFLDLCPWRTKQSELLNEGLILTENPEHIGTHPYHIAGLFYMQEPSAMSVVEAAEIAPGMRVLDLCAAPGGKSGGIAARLCGRGILVSNEIIPNRAKLLARNLERLGIVNAVVTSAHPDAVAEALPQYFDRVVVDAPCSGEGMFRKDPTAIAEWSPEHVSACAKRQQQLLESACRCVAPGGKLIYSTCTFSREENEDVIEEFCRMHPEFTVEMQHRLYPHTCCGEGHFAARLQRNRSSFPDTSALTASAESACTAQKKAGTRSGRAKRSDCIPDAVAVPRIKDKAEIAALTEFLRDSFLDFNDESRLNEFLHEIRRMSDGRIVYAPFTFHENLLRLRILSLGVEVGELLKGRFKPCHSFFVACHGLHSRNEIDFLPESDELRRYLSGNTVPVPVNMCGFAAVSVDGCTLGYGKAVDGVLKNHFPKGLAVAAFR